MQRNEYDSVYRVRALGEKLAKSGAYADWQEVQQALLEQGHAEARQALNDEGVRFTIDANCSIARKGKWNA